MLSFVGNDGFYDAQNDEVVADLYTSSDIKEIVKAEQKEGNDVHYVDVVESKFRLVGMDSNGNSYYCLL